MHSAVLQVFARYLDAHGATDRRAELYDLYADEAPFLVKYKISKKRDLSLEAFQNLPPSGAEETTAIPAYRFGSPALRTWRPDGEERGVAWFDSAESLRDRDVLLAAGFVLEGTDWKIGWAKVVPHQEDWTYAMGLTHTLGEFAHGVAADAERSWLDISYYRLYDLPRPPLLTLPDAKFSCHSESTCCKTNYDIVVPAVAQDIVDAIPWELVHPPLKGVKLSVSDDGTVKLKGQHEDCVFLDEHRHCRVHKLLGRQPFPGCAAFPFHFARTPDGLATAASYVCGSVRGGLGQPLSERADDLYERAAIAQRVLPDTFLLGDEVEVPWEVFRDTEQALLDILDREDLPLWRRLWVGTHILEERVSGNAGYDPAWETAELTPLSSDRKEALQALLLPRLLNFERIQFEEFRGQAFPEVYHDAFSSRDQALLAGYFKNVIFSKKLSYPPNTLATAFNVSTLVYLQALHVLEMSGLKELDAKFWSEIALQSFHSILFKVLVPNLTRSPGFGRWIMRYAALQRAAKV